LLSEGALPSVATQVAAGIGAQVSVSGNDTSGTITVTLGSNPLADDVAHITFAKAYGSTPHIVLTPEGKGSAAPQPYVDQPTGAGFTIGINGTPAAGATYTFTYHTIQ